jgi:hypothetical protein
MKRLMCACLLTAFAALAQDQNSTPGAQSTPDAPKDFWKSIKYMGLLDVNYSLNFNHPASETNRLRNFDLKADQVDLNFGRFALEKSAEPIGFRVDFGLGRTTEILHGAEQAGKAFRYIPQVYLSFKPAAFKGVQLDVGKFYTAAGAEPTETQANWNYSRSLLFAWAAPYYHMGLRASIPVHKLYTAGVQLVNGWNNIYDSNSGKTIGLTGALATSKFSWFHNYYVGPEKPDTNKGMRQLFDTTALFTPNTAVNFYLSLDYGRDKRIGPGADTWIGVAGAARFAPTSWFALSPRLEYFSDRDGFNTGVPQQLKEFTLTGEFKMKQGIIYRMEYRRDWSNVPFFDRGNEPASSKSQPTILFGIVAYFEKKG